MKKEDKPKGRMRHFFYLLAAAGMLLYASTRVEGAREDQTSLLFWAIWLLLAAFIVAANVNILLMGAEERRRLSAVKAAKIRLWENGIASRLEKRQKEHLR
ncbi:hypothetical protein [Paenibacillus sp. HB172176]|uniref:hypothetical protein n=1 Tax=Paenibacillus sp. HB172176 TaxID=2493690 RepID=UPI00143BC22D|nr:hypothetical protein [Paenibacillus sp. HB172176]